MFGGCGKVKGEKRVVRKWKVDSYSFYGEKKKGEMIILYPSPPFLVFPKWEETWEKMSWIGDWQYYPSSLLKAILYIGYKINIIQDTLFSLYFLFLLTNTHNRKYYSLLYFYFFLSSLHLPTKQKHKWYKYCGLWKELHNMVSTVNSLMGNTYVIHSKLTWIIKKKKKIIWQLKMPPQQKKEEKREQVSI